MGKNLFKRALAVFASASIAATIATGSVTTASAANADTSDYAKALQYSLYFYDANMCGDQVGETSHVTWRDDCHTYSDVPGGFHDAGDHVMFGLPQGYSASTLGWGYYEYSDVFEELGLVTHFKTINDYFCQFFKDSTTLSNGSVTNFMYQAGDGTTDHSYWVAPEKQTKSQWGSSLWTSNGASNIAGQYAAALAISYINFGNEEDLTYAKALFNFANQYRSNMSVNEYNSEACTDDICWAAGWLYLATKDSTYLNVFNSLKPSTVYWIHCWNNVTLGNAILDGYINNNWSAANNYINGQISSSYSSYWFLQQWGSARYNTTMQLCALVVAKYTNNSNYQNWAKWQMTYILGGNGAKACFLTGLGDNSAKYPHHRAASGYEGYEGSNGVNGNTGYSSNGHTLIGALVGGPTDSSGTYTDSVNDYTANEVAIDYNAGCVGALAALYDLYGTGSVVTYINDEIEVCLDSQAVATYDITSNVSNCTIALSTTNAEANTTVSFTLTPTVDNPEGPELSITTASGSTVSYSGSDGSYTFTMPAEAVTITASYTQGATILYGDANGDGRVNAMDATLVARHAVGTYTLADSVLTACDVNLDGRINAMDATLIARHAVGTVESLPV